MNIVNYLNFSALQERISQGYVNVRHHKKLPLDIYCYSKSATFDNVWDEVTCKTRGLIVHSTTGEIIARPFEKFFNLGQTGMPEYSRENLPTYAPEITDKLDGCFLGNTRLNLWGGGSISIREVVQKKLSVTLVGRDKQGSVTPCKVIGWKDNGTKNTWLELTVDCRSFAGTGGGKSRNCLPITPNHIVFANGHEVPAKDLVVGDTLTTYDTHPEFAVQHFMESGLLGDGSLIKTGKSCSYTDGHKTAHSAYTKEIKRWLGECAIRTRSRISGFGTPMLDAGSKAYLSLISMYQKWYPNGIKTVPNDLSWMDDFTVAKWYMDDGSLAHANNQQDRALFATNGFTEQGVTRLAEKLHTMYGVSCTVYQSKGWCLRINAGQPSTIENFWKAVAPHIVPCMRYKLPKKYRKHGYIKRNRGTECRTFTTATVTNIRHMALDEVPFRSGRKGFDIQTTTGNYMIKGVLVHNSMITLYPYDGRWHAASKGSFHSEHADWANAWLVKHCPTQNWPQGYTPVCEMIAEEVEHHVVHYGKAASGLYLLALINNETGEEMENLGPGSYKNNIDAVPLCAIDLQGALSENLKNAEGYVLAWSRPGQSPFRVKVKFTDFLRLQRLVHHTGPKEILDYMSRPELRCYLEEVLNPATSHPVFIQYVHQWQMRFNNLFSAVYGSARMWLEVVQAELGGAPRKAYAEEIKKHGYPGVMFAMLDADGSPVSQEKIRKLVWKEVAKLIPAEDDFHGLVTQEE